MAQWAAHDGSHQVAFGVHVGHALLVYDLPRLGREFVPDEGQELFYLLHLVQFQGGTRIALDAAGAATGGQIAQEFLFQYVETDDNVSNL